MTYAGRVGRDSRQVRRPETFSQWVPRLRAIGLVLALGTIASFARAADLEEEGPDGSIPTDLNEVARQLDNPLTSLWSLILENKTLIQEGDAVGDREIASQTFFQPGLPIPLGKHDEMVFIARPVFPFATVPSLDASSSDGTNGRTTGFGDIQMLSLIGPNRTDGIVWGLGATMKLPTNSDDDLGVDKWQLGPSAMLFSIDRPWLLGALVQSWWSVAGEGSARSTSQTDIQYVVRYALPDAWQVGVGPTVSTSAQVLPSHSQVSEW